MKPSKQGVQITGAAAGMGAGMGAIAARQLAAPGARQAHALISRLKEERHA